MKAILCDNYARDNLAEILPDNKLGIIWFWCTIEECESKWEAIATYRVCINKKLKTIREICVAVQNYTSKRSAKRALIKIIKDTFANYILEWSDK